VTLARKLWLGALSIALALLALALWLVGTESGLRFVFAKAEPYLPAELSLNAPTGTILRGVCVDSIDWNSASLEAEIRNVCVDIELARLVTRHLAIRSLNVEELSIELADAADTEPPGELPTFESPMDISVKSSSLRNLSFRRSQLHRSLDAVQFSGSLSESKLDVWDLAVRSVWLNADLAGDIEFAGLYPGSLDLSWRWSESPSLQLAGFLKLAGDLRRYELNHTLSAPQRLSTTGSFSYVSNELTLDVENTWEMIEWPIGQSLLQSSTGSLLLHGGPSRLDVTLDGLGRLDDLPETKVLLKGELDVQGIQFAAMSASNDHGLFKSSGNVRWAPEQSFDVEFALSNLDPSLVSQLLKGQVGSAGRASGTLLPGAPKITISINELDGIINGHPLTGSGEFEYASDRLTVSKGQIGLGHNQIDIGGAVGDRLSLDANLHFPAIDELLPDAAGSLSGVLNLRGSREQPEVRVRAIGAEVAWGDYAIGDLKMEADLANSQGVFADIDLQKLILWGEEFDSASVSVKGVLDQHSVQTEFAGKGGHLKASVNGGYLDGRWAGTIDSLTVDSDIAGLWASPEPADITASSDALSLSRICLVRDTASGSACVELSTSQSAPTAFDLEVRALPLGVLPFAFPQNVSLSGLGDARASGSYSGGQLTGDASVDLREARVDAAIDGEDISVALSNAVWRAAVVDNRLTALLRIELADDAGNAEVDVTVDDVLDIGSAVSGRGHIAINNMSLLAVLVPDISNPRGALGGNLELSGTLSEPEFLGTIQLSDGSFQVRQAGIEVRELNVQLSQSSLGRLRFEGSANSGDGRIAIQGDTWLSADRGVRSEVLLTGENFELARLPDLELVASPSIAVVFDDRAATVTGNLLIPTANIGIKEVPDTATSPSPDAIVHEQQNAESSARRRIDIDVAVGLGEEVSFSGFGLTTDIDGVVRLRGGTHAPYTGSGKLSLTKGRYKAYGQDLEIERGQLIFNGPLENPQLDVRAIRRTTDVVAGIQLTGTPSQLRSSVFSEPPLRDAEALSYLLTGRPLASATSAGEGDTLNAAAFALGVSSAGNIVSQVRSGLGLETLAIEGGAEDGRLIAGKRFGDRLLVEYGYGLIDKLGTLLLRYQLTDRITLESRTGTVSNLDVLYSVKKQ